MKNIKDLPPNPKSGFRQGYFSPANPEKYMGDITKIIYRSSWEKKFMTMCDSSHLVINWSSEPVAINYISPLDQKVHRYFVDFFCSVKTNNDDVKKYLIEIKPKKQTVFEAKNPKTFKTKERYMEHLKTVVINKAKWAAASEYASNLGYEFKVWTEENLNML
jgi:hypothetical protein